MPHNFQIRHTRRRGVRFDSARSNFEKGRAFATACLSRGSRALPRGNKLNAEEKEKEGQEKEDEEGRGNGNEKSNKAWLRPIVPLWSSATKGPFSYILRLHFSILIVSRAVFARRFPPAGNDGKAVKGLRTSSLVFANPGLLEIKRHVALIHTVRGS